MHNLCKNFNFWLWEIFRVLLKMTVPIKWSRLNRYVREMTGKTVWTYWILIFFLIKLQKTILLTKTPHFLEKKQQFGSVPPLIRPLAVTCTMVFSFMELYKILSSSSLILLLYKTVTDKWYVKKEFQSNFCSISAVNICMNAIESFFKLPYTKSEWHTGLVSVVLGVCLMQT